MTLHYLQTARLNATPLAKHIDTPESYGEITREIKNAVASGDYESAIKWARKREAFLLSQRSKLSVHDDAEAIRHRTAGMWDQTQEEVSDETILSVISANPGQTAYQIAEAIQRKVSNTRVRLKAMEQRGQIKVEIFKHPQSHRWSRLYHPVANPPKPRTNKRRASPVRDKVLAFIKANPGCSTPEVGKHMGCSTKAAAAHISEVRKVANVRTERAPGKGNHTPARHWIED